jgi:membrane-associated phospholipid phosphatase
LKEQAVSPLSAWKFQKLTAPLIAVVAALCLIPFASIEYRIVRHVLRELPLSSILSTAVQLGTALVDIGLVLIIWRMDAKNRRFVAVYLIALIAAGTTNALIKQVAGRTRPEWSTDLSPERKQQLLHDRSIESLPLIGGKRLMADHWLWLSANRPFFEDKYASFPSGHACGVYVTAAFLCALYPEARLIWLTGALLCALGRVRYGRHFPGDVIFGGALGWMMAQWIFSLRWPARAGTRLEQFLSRK